VAQQRDSIFIRVGGFARVSGIVSDFYSRVMADDVLRPYFAGVDMATQIDHQTKFVATLMGGPSSYTDEHLRRVHARLDITAGAFDVMMTVFRETLEDVVVGELMSRRHLVVKEG
jgi:hemoglobin